GVQFLLDDAVAVTDTTSPYSTPFDTTTVSDGSHTIAARAFDAAGNVATSSTVTVTVSNGTTGGDTTPPTVSVTSPANGATVSGTITVTASASDDVGVIGVQFLLDDAVAVTDTTSPYSTPFDTTGVSDGPHTIAARAFDAAGNVATSSTVTVNVANSGSGSGSARFEETAVSITGTGWQLRGPEVATFSDGTAGSSDVAGDTASFTFSGTAVSWIGLRCNVCGIATVSIDGVERGSVDTTGTAAIGSPGLASESVFTASGLAAGTHTLVIRVTGTTTSDGAHIIVDAFDVTP
ncbi:MAG: Ig-like domain-containing protein, partial [Burkholderiales bacterium]